ncbi:MAG: DoxX family protein [Verrucomicrobiota bacterium]
MFVLRFLSGVALVYYQGWKQLQQGWGYLWSDGKWELVDHFVARGQGTPVSMLFAILVAVFYFVSPVLLMLGFLTRLSALVIFIGIMVTINLGLQGVISTSLHSQTTALYLLVCVFFILNGGGIIAVDRLFDRRRGKQRQAGGLYA